MTIPLPRSAVVFGPGVTVVCVVLLLVLVANLRSVRRPGTRHFGDDAPLVSVLVPARDEEETIGACVAALTAQDYPNLEVVVLDDNSTDATADIVGRCADPRVKLVAGTPLPAGWTGKNWACDQLAARARGDILCFVDADTVLAPSAVAGAIGELEDRDVGLVTLLVASGQRSVAGSVLLPMVTFGLLGLFPAWLMNHRDRSPLGLALGPFIMVTRAAYTDVGGHAAHRGDVVDDVALCRSVKTAGWGVHLGNGTDLVRTRWYPTTAGIWEGFSKNAFGALGYSITLAALTLVVGVVVLFLPFARVGAGVWAGDVPGEAVVQVGLLLTARTVTSVAGRDPLWSVPTHPMAVIFWVAALAWSVLIYAFGRDVEWRGRAVAVRHGE